MEPMDSDEARTIAEVMHCPLNEFAAARNERVRDLRKQGKQELAQRLAGLRKPSVALWTLNQASEYAADDLEAVRSAGERLRRAQEHVVKGERSAADEMQQAVRDQRRAIDALSRRLGMVLTAAGRSASDETLRRVSEGLRTASIGDSETWAALREGRLLSEPQAASFPLVEVPGSARVKQERAEREDRSRMKRLEAAEADVRRAEQVERTAQEQEEAARQRREQATQALEEARTTLLKLQHGG
jgi:hypothetical protein